MKIVIPKVIVQVAMSEYAPELEGKFLSVWVNPSMEKMQGYFDLVNEMQAAELEKARDALIEKPQEPPANQTILQRTFDQLTKWIGLKRTQKDEGIDLRLLKWYVEMWSQGPEESRWSIDELKELEQQDPTFLSWMISQTWQARTAHIERKKKA